MTKQEISKKIHEETGIETILVQTVIESFMENVKEAITKGQTVQLRGFGTFGNKVRKEKVARVITEKKSIIVPEHRIPYFKPCNSFKQSVK